MILRIAVAVRESNDDKSAKNHDNQNISNQDINNHYNYDNNHNDFSNIYMSLIFL